MTDKLTEILFCFIKNDGDSGKGRMQTAYTIVNPITNAGVTQNEKKLPNVNAINIPMLHDKTIVLPIVPRTLKKKHNCKRKQIKLLKYFKMSLMIIFYRSQEISVKKSGIKTKRPPPTIPPTTRAAYKQYTFLANNIRVQLTYKFH